MKAKILLYDIETSPMTAYVWRRHDTDVAKVKRDTELLSVAWKWLGEKKVHVMTRPNFKPNSEARLTRKLYSLLDQAHVVVGHNALNFDNRKANTFFAKFKLGTPSFFHTVDTCLVAKQHFGFTSNKLDDLGTYFKLGNKIKTEIDLWDDCMSSKPRAFQELARYNKRDVVLLEKVYERLLPWMTNHPNIALLQGGIKDVNGCPNCGSVKDVVKTGFRCTQRQVFQEMRCLTQEKAYKYRYGGKDNKYRGCGRVYKIPARGVVAK